MSDDEERQLRILVVPRMSRMSITLPEPAMNWLKREAKRLGISVGELIRRIIDNARA